MNSFLFFLGLGALSTLCLISFTYLFGVAAGTYDAARQSTFRKRAISITGERGRSESFIILAGDPGVVNEAFEIVIATTERVQEMSNQKIRVPGKDE